MKYILILLLCFIFISCTASFPKIDVSNEKKYSKIINKTFKILTPLIIHANLVDDYKSKKIRSYAIRDFDNQYGNRYVLWRKQINKNTIIKIKTILKYSNYGNIIKIKIDILNNNEFVDAPIFISDMLTINENDFVLMNRKYFEEVNE